MLVVVSVLRVHYFPSRQLREIRGWILSMIIYPPHHFKNISNLLDKLSENSIENGNANYELLPILRPMLLYYT